jgi:hypothetical protein
MSGNLSYPAGSNNITGAVSTASGMNGTATGRFYGPAGQEIGGTLAVQSGVGAAASTLVGAFGGKK